MNGRIVACAMTLLTATALLSPLAADAQEHQPAVWHTHELDFQYRGFTSHYSCSGLQNNISTILLKLGARNDPDMVTPGVCSGSSDRPSRISGVHIKVATLQPATGAEQGTGQGTAVDAYWKPVTVSSASIDVDCELIEQVNSDILPLFTTRNVRGSNIDCIPHQASRIPSSLSLEVLTVAPPAK